MADANDSDLMREYTAGNSESAFTGLVQRHINFVYSAALRFTGNAPDAEDITQAVFIILARKIPALRERASLTGWLYETTRFTARQWARSRASQQAREQEAYMDSLIQQSDTDPLWKQLAPVLEDAMARLSEKDRALLALRFFENKSVAETASLLGLNEWTVRKRAERAVEKLRLFFSRRGITVPAPTLTTVLSAHSIQAAPVGLVKTISAVALTKGVAASTSTLTLTKGALKLMFWTKTNIAISTGIGLLLVAGIATLSVEKVRGHETNSIPLSGKFNSGRALLVSVVFAEVPDKLLDSLHLQWQPGDAGSSTVMMSASQEAELARAWKNNSTILGRERIAFAPNPGSTAQGSLSSTPADKNLPAKARVGTHIDVMAVLASDSKSVDLKLYTEWQQLADNAHPDYGSLESANANGITTSATVPLAPAQTIIIRSPIGSESLLADNSDNASGSRSLVILVSPAIQSVAVRLQKLAPGQGPLTWTNSVPAKPANN